MTENTLSKNTAPTAEGQEAFDDTVGGACTKGQKVRIVRALEGYGWNQSSGVRTVMWAFVESAAVRDAVFDHLRQQHAA